MIRTTSSRRVLREAAIPARLLPRRLSTVRAIHTRAEHCLLALIAALALDSRTALPYTIPANAGYGGIFDDGGVHSVPPNLIANPPFPSPAQVGALVTNGSHLNVLPTGDIYVNGNSAGDSVGIVARNGASVSLLNGAEVVVDDESGFNAIGIIAEDDATVSAAGTFEIIDRVNGFAKIAETTGTAHLHFSAATEVSEDGNGNAIGFVARDDSRIIFDGSVHFRQFGNGGVTPVHLMGNSKFEFSGDMSIDNGLVIGAGALLEANSSADFVGGVFNITSFFTIPILQLNNETTVRIWGGAFNAFENGVSVDPLIRMISDSELRIRGTDFNHPKGYVFGSSGLLTGRLADGQLFRFRFTREEKADIYFVPEPCALFLVAIAVGTAMFVLSGRTRPAKV